MYIHIYTYNLCIILYDLLYYIHLLKFKLLCKHSHTYTQIHIYTYSHTHRYMFIYIEYVYKCINLGKCT